MTSAPHLMLSVFVPSHHVVYPPPDPGSFHFAPPHALKKPASAWKCSIAVSVVSHEKWQVLEGSCRHVVSA